MDMDIWSIVNMGWGLKKEGAAKEREILNKIYFPTFFRILFEI